MKLFQAASLGLSLLAISAGGALAQSGMTSSDTMSKPMAAPMSMSKHDMKMMKTCQGMSHDMMMKKAGCMKMMKMHPDMMSGGTMGSH
jgi:hypothetical protein